MRKFDETEKILKFLQKHDLEHLDFLQEVIEEENPLKMIYRKKRLKLLVSEMNWAS